MIKAREGGRGREEWKKEQRKYNHRRVSLVTPRFFLEHKSKFVIVPSLV